MQHAGLPQTLRASPFISWDIDPETLWIIYFHVANDLEPGWDCLGEGDICSQSIPRGMQIRFGTSRPPSMSGNWMEKVVVSQGCNTLAREMSPPPSSLRSSVMLCI